MQTQSDVATLVIATPDAGEPYATTSIHGCKGVIDLGDKHKMEYSITAREIAEDLAREINGARWSNASRAPQNGLSSAPLPAPSPPRSPAKQRFARLQRVSSPCLLKARVHRTPPGQRLQGVSPLAHPPRQRRKPLRGDHQHPQKIAENPKKGLDIVSDNGYYVN
jgi:hypothetical protein